MAIASLKRSTLKVFNRYNNFLAGNIATLPDYELISTQVLSSTASSISFTGLDTAASSYKHLQIRAVVRDNRSGYAGSNCWLRFNGAPALYSNHSFYGTGSSTGGGAAVSAGEIYLSDIVGGGGATNGFSPFITDVLDFSSTTKNKVARTIGGTNSGYNWMSLSSGSWMSTNPVTSITIFSTLGSFVAGSRFSLYGLRA